MAVAARIGIAFNRSVARDRHWPRIALRAIGGEIDVRQRLRSAYDNIWDTHARTLVESRAKIGVHSDGRSDEVDDGAGVGVHGGAGNVLLPKIVAGEGNEPVEAGALPRAHGSASALLVTARA